MTIKVISVDRDEYRCMCPFHEDTNPSLSINIKKNVSNCFAGCAEARGSVIDVIMKLEGIPRAAAWRLYVTGKIFEFVEDPNSHTSKKAVSGNYNGIVWLPGDHTDYLLKRGFTRSTIRYWDMQYSPDIRHIRVPIINKEGKLLSYSYRTIEPNITPKYLHPGLSKKSGTLFGENFFEDHNGIVNLVEGSLDCIWLWQIGYANTLAFLGSPTVEQIERVFQFGNKLRLCFDNDKAGIEDSRKLIIAAEKKGCSYWCISLPEGKDVQDMSMIEMMDIMKRS